MLTKRLLFLILSFGLFLSFGLTKVYAAPSDCSPACTSGRTCSYDGGDLRWECMDICTPSCTAPAVCKCSGTCSCTEDPCASACGTNQQCVYKLGGWACEDLSTSCTGKCSGGCTDGKTCAWQGAEGRCTCQSICPTQCAGTSACSCSNGTCECKEGEAAVQPAPGYTGPIIVPSQLLGAIGAILYPVGIAIGLFFVVTAGYAFMTSEGEPQKVKAAQEGLTSAVVGMIFIVLSTVILNIIINSLIGG